MKESMKNKRILIVGLGKSGIAAFTVLFIEGALLSVYDDRDIEKDDPELFMKLRGSSASLHLKGELSAELSWDMIVLSPGVPPALPFIENAKKRGTKVIGEVELAYLLGQGRYAAVTGTNGKTTTTTLIGEIFAAAGLKTIVAGNIGTPVVSKAVSADTDTWLVTEVSSFQLETIEKFRPKIAVFLNLTPDHIDRHKSMGSYAEAKARIFENQSEDDVLIYNADDELVSLLAEKAPAKKLPFSRGKTLAAGAYICDGMLVFKASENENPVALIRKDELRIPGAHNLENALAAAAAAFSAGVSPSVTADVLKNFKGVDNRIEFVSEYEGIRFVNDSKGTNPDAAIKAIEAISQGGKILLIAGGYDKDADFTEYVRAAKGKVKKFLLLGATAEKIKNAALNEGFSEKDIIMTDGMTEAVRIGFELAEDGDTVLLSPACASWDMYKDFEERGDHFREAVAGLETGK